MDTFMFGERIRYFRKRAGYTQEQIAEKLEVTPHHIGQMERGKSLPSIPVFYNLSLILGVPTDCFFMDDNRMYAEYAALKFEKLLDKFSDEQLVTFVEIQQAVHSVLEKPEESLDLFVVPEKKNKKDADNGKVES